MSAEKSKELVFSTSWESTFLVENWDLLYFIKKEVKKENFEES